MMVSRKIELFRLYSATARSYVRRYRKIQAEKYKLVLKKLPKKIGKIIDVGCGTGEFLIKIGKRADLAVGVDISPTMIKTFPKSVARVYFVVSDADRLPFKDGAFDCAISVTLLQNMPEPLDTVKEIQRIVRVGGTVILTTLKKKHTVEMLSSWVRNAGLSLKESGEIGEDVYCVCEKSS